MLQNQQLSRRKGAGGQRRMLKVWKSCCVSGAMYTYFFALVTLAEKCSEESDNQGQKGVARDGLEDRGQRF